MENDTHILRFFLDSEFNEHAMKLAIDPISIALVPENENRKTLYAVSADFKADKITPWLAENVVVHLPDASQRLTNDQIRNAIAHYLESFKSEGVKKVEILWAYNGATDNVVLANFFGGLMGLRSAFHEAGLPKPEFRDVKELTRATGMQKGLPENAHDCLADALWARDVFKDCVKRLKPEHRFLIG